MKFCLRIVLFLFFVTATLTQDGLDLLDALDDVAPTPPKPKEQPKAPEKPKTGVDPTKKPSSGDSGGFGFDLNDALGPDTNPKPEKPASNQPKNGEGGETFNDSDLADVSDGEYKPDSSGGGKGRAADSGYDNQGGGDQPQDPDLLWDQMLKMLNANLPEEFYMWISNLKQILTPLFERVRDLLQAMP